MSNFLNNLNWLSFETNFKEGGNEEYFSSWADDLSTSPLFHHHRSIKILFLNSKRNSVSNSVAFPWIWSLFAIGKGFRSDTSYFCIQYLTKIVIVIQCIRLKRFQIHSVVNHSNWYNQMPLKHSHENIMMKVWLIVLNPWTISIRIKSGSIHTYT